jgi:redox-sensitive bicupin YhaK (pirin superfamily)
MYRKNNMKNTMYYPSATRGDSNIGWLHGRHSFSIGPFYDPGRMAFGALRVLNDDTVQPGTGFGTHGHNNVEIISIPLSGTISHQDDTGKEATISPGEIQVMSAGKGIRHSEYNNDKVKPINFLQLWLAPNQQDVMPRYQQISIRQDLNTLQQIVSPDSDDEGLWVYQNAWLHKGSFCAGEKLRYEIKKQGNGVYIFVISGKIIIQGQELQQRDALAVTQTASIEISVQEQSEFIIIDVPVG